MASILSLVLFPLCILNCVYCVPEVKLVPLPVLNNYSASDTGYDDGGMGPLYNFARSFINTALPGGFPADFVNKTIHDFGSLDIQQALGMFKGYIAAIAVGLLFILIFPLIGLCFCCCRLCGNCGGSNDQTVSDNIHIKRRVFAAVLFVLTVFTLVGNICTYVSNDRISVALDKISDTVDNNLDDIDSYLDLVQSQVETIGITNLKITKDGILHYMDANALQDDISTYVIDSLSGGALTHMQQHITDTASAFKQLIDNKNILVNMGIPVPGNLVSTLDSQKTLFDSFESNDIIKKMKDEVSTKVSSQLSGPTINTQKDKVVKAFDKMNTQVVDVVDEIRNFRQNAKSGLDLQDYKRQVRSYTDTAKDYDKYRYSAAAGLGAITTVVVTLQFLGLLFGSVGQGWSTGPAKRGCVSAAGGNLLMASVGFVFLFSWLLMLLTTLCFSLGALLERFVCQPLSSTDLQLIKIANSFAPSIPDIDADLVDILKDCRSDKSAYTAFHLSSKFDLTTLDNTFNAQKQEIDKSLKDVLANVRSISSVSFTSRTAPLNQFKASLSGLPFLQLRQTFSQLSSMGNAQSRVALNEINDALQKLENAKNQVDNWKTEFTTGMASAQSDITAKMSQVMDAFKNKITSVAEKYVNSTKTDIRDNMGKCSPVWNLYESIVQVGFCKYTIDAFNGFWFSIGWCIFFSMPSIIFSVKLAKHYRRMNVENGLDRESSISYNEPAHRSNKVGHLDDLPPLPGN